MLGKEHQSAEKIPKNVIVEYAKIMPLNQTKSDKCMFVMNMGIYRFLEINMLNSFLFSGAKCEVKRTQ